MAARPSRMHRHLYTGTMWNGLSVYLSSTLSFSISLSPSSSFFSSAISRSLVLQMHPLPPGLTTLTRLSSALPTLLPLSLSPSRPLFWPFSLARSLAAVPPRIYTLFSAGNCLSLGAARGSTYGRSRAMSGRGEHGASRAVQGSAGHDSEYGGLETGCAPGKRV